MNIKTYLLIPLALTAAACSNDNSSNGTPVTNAAVVAGAAPDFSSGAVSLAQTTSPYTAQNNLDATISDIAVRADGDHFFLIRRSGTNQILRYEGATPTKATYTYSTNDTADEDSNPYDIVVASPTKAYLIRYGSGKLWIVNPSATTEATFKTGEIDLSQYDADGIPEMSAGLIKNGKLYVAMQRLQNFAATQPGYVAVIDTTTDQEISTGAGDAPLKGIKLSVNDPFRLVSIPGNDLVMAAADGGYDGSFTQQYNGGLVSINPDNKYTTATIVDDGDSTTHPYGFLSDMDLAASDRGYFTAGGGFGSPQTLYRFNPAGGTPVAVNGFQSQSLGPISVEPASGNLWVGQTSSSAPGLTVIGFQNGAETVLKPLIDTVLNPLNIDFLSLPTN
jgi:hypothetical protein